MTARDALAAIRERADAATEGPWVMLGGNEYVSPIGLIVAPDDDGVTGRDAEFIAHARTDVPALVEVVHAVIELADNYAARAQHAPTPRAQWADIEADLRRALTALDAR